ncbi:hypothetical protein [Microbulbifer rhizosphaerae]|uniref:hypothetical protein n=1 Tax=Microbulbifer rhizosphaerae TaxID=1562603 RepID=UPI001616173F|nr:hypothetical protein [Microbulbifer rhizosphaerae]
MKNLRHTLLVIFMFGKPALACSPVSPEIIPPNSPGGEFKYIYPDPKKELEKSVASAADVAIVKVHADSVSEPKDGYKVAVAVVELLHGWGYQSGRYMKYIRVETSCGEPEKINGTGWFVALLEKNEIYALIPYEKVKKKVQAKGKPDYVYSAIGATGK